MLWIRRPLFKSKLNNASLFSRLEQCKSFFTMENGEKKEFNVFYP